MLEGTLLQLLGEENVLNERDWVRDKATSVANVSSFLQIWETTRKLFLPWIDSFDFNGLIGNDDLADNVPRRLDIYSLLS